MLAADYFPTHDSANNPCLVWLHGLLGCRHDWYHCRQYLTQWPHLTIDLPGHGDSINCNATDFNQVCHQLIEVIDHYAIDRYILIGYSLGGRIAMYYSCFSVWQGLIGLVIEGGHPGLISSKLKQQRLLHDQQWAKYFQQYPLEHVLDKWYQQPVFADLSVQEKITLIAERLNNSGAAIASMLDATSLGRQVNLAERLLTSCQNNALPLCYLCGEYDAKFQRIAKEYHLPLRTIASAGHNAHRANPLGYAQQLISFLKEC